MKELDESVMTGMIRIAGEDLVGSWWECVTGVFGGWTVVWRRV